MIPPLTGSLSFFLLLTLEKEGTQVLPFSHVRDHPVLSEVYGGLLLYLFS